MFIAYRGFFQITGNAVFIIGTEAMITTSLNIKCCQIKPTVANASFFKQMICNLTRNELILVFHRSTYQSSHYLNKNDNIIKEPFLVHGVHICSFKTFKSFIFFFARALGINVLNVIPIQQFLYENWWYCRTLVRPGCTGGTPPVSFSQCMSATHQF